MSTYFRLSKPIPLEDIKNKCSFMVKINDKPNEQKYQWFIDEHGNYLHWDINSNGMVTDIRRYGGNNASYILFEIEQTFLCTAYSEHDKEYHIYQDPESNVITVNFEGM